MQVSHNGASHLYRYRDIRICFKPLSFKTKKAVRVSPYGKIYQTCCFRLGCVGQEVANISNLKLNRPRNLLLQWFSQ